jgi:hypothetical protein
MSGRDKEPDEECGETEDGAMTMALMGFFVPLAAAGLRANKSPREAVEYFEEMMDILMAEEKSKKKVQ